MDRRAKLQSLTRPTTTAALQNATTLAKRGDRDAQLELAAALAWVAYACPDASPTVWDAVSACWLGRGEAPQIMTELPQVPLPDSFWDAFWAVVDGHDEGYDAISITLAVASLSAAVDPAFGDLAEQHAREHRGAKAALTRPIPGLTDVEALALCPPDSLGRALHNMIIENGYDPEVLDRNAIALQELPPSLHYLNTRILQMHDVWHLVAGYETTSSNEIAISAFQLAQFGHNYSAMFLAAVMTISTFKEPRGFSILMQIMTEAWQHGRQTPSMMDIEWEEEWTKSLDQIRKDYQIDTYASVFPADLLETVSSAGLWQKLKLGYQLTRFNSRLRRDASAAP